MDRNIRDKVCAYQNVGGLYLNDSLGKQSTDFQSKSTVKLFFLLNSIVKLNSE